MLSADTIYMLNYGGKLGAYTRTLIWNKQHSCQFVDELNWDDNNYSRTFTETINASTKLDSLDKSLKATVETADTAKYNSYTKTHPLSLDGISVHIILAIRHSKHWKFIYSNVFNGDEN